MPSGWKYFFALAIMPTLSAGRHLVVGKNSHGWFQGQGPTRTG